MARRTIVMGITALLLVVPLLAASQQDVSQQEPENLSVQRTLGVGIQVDFPWGGLISARFWWPPTFGIEGVLFLWGDGGEIEGSATARALYRVSDAPVVDFYVAGGGTVPFSTYGENKIVFSLVGGIEFGFRAARNLAWNIEFGLTYSTWGEVQMAFGTGIHIYF
jgi:hypothetical protein